MDFYQGHRLVVPNDTLNGRIDRLSLSLHLQSPVARIDARQTTESTRQIPNVAVETYQLLLSFVPRQQTPVQLEVSGSEGFRFSQSGLETVLFLSGLDELLWVHTVDESEIDRFRLFTGFLPSVPDLDAFLVTDFFQPFEGYRKRQFLS